MHDKKMAMSDHTILITGPTGSGKSRKAKLIHQYSARKNKPFIHAISLKVSLKVSSLAIRKVHLQEQLEKRPDS